MYQCIVISLTNFAIIYIMLVSQYKASKSNFQHKAYFFNVNNLLNSTKHYYYNSNRGTSYNEKKNIFAYLHSIKKKVFPIQQSLYNAKNNKSFAWLIIFHFILCFQSFSTLLFFRDRLFLMNTDILFKNNLCIRIFSIIYFKYLIRNLIYYNINEVPFYSTEITLIKENYRYILIQYYLLLLNDQKNIKNGTIDVTDDVWRYSE